MDIALLLTFVFIAGAYVVCMAIVGAILDLVFKDDLDD